METNEQSTDQNTQSSELSQDWLFDAFSEPRTMPTHWDLSEMSGSVIAPGNNGPSHSTAYREHMLDDQADYQDAGGTLHLFYLNPFPEPRTFPIYWDLCW
jgi:hypothetical protein